ncbi:MAG TPA: class I SAM-dependent methyltransferase [Mycobacteriales bacterium]
MSESTSPYGEQAWDERYRANHHTWSGRPNPVLVAEVSELPPGSALDVGAGEGGDACWLASRGWQVTGADISSVALERAAAQTKERDFEVTWLHRDLSQESAPEAYDLVTSHFVHLPIDRRRSLFENLAAAVAPGGTLLVVGHDPSDALTGVPRPHLEEAAWPPGEVVAALGAGWTVVVAEARPRTATDPDGQEVTVHDAVMRARRDGP